MAEALTTEPIPLVFGPDGVMRVRGTRVTLETVLAAFAEGATAEEARRRRDIHETRRSNESRWPPDGIRDRLIARRQG